MENAKRLSIETHTAAIKLAASHAPVRIGMRGTSMLPDFREGMVLEVTAQTTPRIGDVAVFRAGGRLVAHRVIAVKRDEIVCAGDAQPDSLDEVPRADIVGVVERVYDEEQRRVDTPAWRMRGILRARLRPLRAVALSALPFSRKRVYVALFHVMSAAVRGDDSALKEALRREAPWRIAAMAHGHRCGAALCVALERLPDDEYAVALRERLRKDRWSTVVRQKRLADHLRRVIDALRSSGIEPLLLKGAQRIACGIPEASIYESGDIDILVPPDSIEPACEALRRIGYRQDPHPQLDYDRHHHAAPLFAENAVPVEVHRALSVRGLNLPTTWDELQKHVRLVSSQFGDVRVLDSVGTALHLAVHCLQRPALREIVLLAQQLQRLEENEFSCLRDMLVRERRYAIPLNGAMLLAARLAGLQWGCDDRSKRFARWMLVREDLPRPLRARPEYVDAWLSRLPMPRSDGFLRAVLWFVTGVGIACYAPFMRRPNPAL
jgi:hypothetical protein